jgi:cytochrome c biogenesis protein
MLREMRSFREHAAEASLRRFAHRAEFRVASTEGLTARLAAYLGHNGFRRRVDSTRPDGSTLIAAKAGSYHRLGYLFTHIAIVVICIGGLLDGNLPLKLMQLAGMKVAETRDRPQSQVPRESRLSPANLSFRGFLLARNARSIP